MKSLLFFFSVMLSLHGFAQKTDSVATEHPLSLEQKKNILLNELRTGGALDYFTIIKGHENDSVEVKPGIFITKLEAAFRKLGITAFSMQIKVEDLLAVWEKRNGRPATPKEKEYLVKGFRK